MNVERIRADFPILTTRANQAPLAYLDNAATTHKPESVLRAMDEYYRTSNANPHRGVYKLSEQSTRQMDAARKKIAGFVGARAEHLVFTKNATEGFNLAANGLANGILQKGDTVLATQLEHHANFVPWQQLAKRHKLKFRVVKITPNGEIDEADLAQQLAQKPKVLAISMASNVLGALTPIERIAKMAHDVGTVVVADATQAVPHAPVRLSRAGVDFAAFSAHKMLGPQGIGALYMGGHWADELGPFLFGGDMIDSVNESDTVFATGVQKFEAGTGNPAGAVGFAAACEYLSRLGMDNVRAHEKKMRKEMLEALSNVPKTEIYGKADDALAIVPFNVSDIHPHDVAQILDSFNVAVRSGNHCAHPLFDALSIPGSVRASAYVYNTRADVEQFAKALAQVARTFG